MNTNAPKYQPSNGKLSAVTPIPLTDFLTMLEKSNSGIVQNPTLILSDRQHSNPILGEECAGTIVDIRTGVVYDVMLMPGELTCVTWAEAKTSINAAGGDLPTPVEMLMLNGLLGRLAFPGSYWTDEKVRFDGDAEDSITYFSDGVFDFSDAADRMSARGVRRISVGDVADENLDEVDDNTVVVPAPAIPAKAATHVRPGLAPAPEIPECLEIVAPDSGLTLEKIGKLVGAQRRACDLLEATGMPAFVEAAGALRSATGDLWDAVQEQVAINALPPKLDSWMMTPAGLARVLVGALRKERINEGEYNDAVEDCIMAVVGTISAGPAADLPASASAPDLSDRPDLQQLRDSMRVDFASPAPKVRIEEVVETLAQLRATVDEAIDDDATAVCRRASRIIEGLLPHAGAGVQA
jgi:hypothetical protein